MRQPWIPFTSAVLATLVLASCAHVTPASTSLPGDLTPMSVGSPQSDAVQHLAVSRANGAVYASGTTAGSLDGVNQGGTDVFIRRFDRSGKLLWRKQLGTTHNDQAAGVATDTAGNVYVGMDYPTYYYDVSILYKFSANGKLLWKRSPKLDGLIAVRNDAKGNVYVFGDKYFESTDNGVSESYSPTGTLLKRYYTNTGLGIGGYYQKSAVVDAAGISYVAQYTRDDQYTDLSLIAYDKNAAQLWTTSIGGSWEGSSGEWESTGVSVEDLHAKDAFLYAILYRYASSEYFVGKFNKATGQELWRKPLGFIGQGVTADQVGNVLIVGRTSNSQDMVYRKLSASGATLWSKTFGSSAADNLRDVAYYGDNEFYAGGFAAAALPNKPYRGGRDGALMRLSSSGARTWVDQFGEYPAD